MDDFETYYNKLRGQVSGSGSAAPDNDDDFNKFYEGLKMDIGSIPDTRPKEPAFNASGNVPSFNVADSPLVKEIAQSAQSNLESDYRKQLETMQAEENPKHFETDRNAMLGVKARNIPGLKQLYTGGDIPGIGHVGGLDDFATNPKVDKIADLLRSFYIPGAGPANISGLTGAAETAVAKLLPKLSNTIGGRIAQKGISEAVVGAPLGAAQTQMFNPDASLGELAKGAGVGAVFGAGLGALGKGAAEALRYGKGTAERLTGNTIREVAENLKRVSSPFVDNAVAGNPVARGYTENVARTFGRNATRSLDDVVEPPPASQQAPIRTPVEPTSRQQGIRGNYQNQLGNGNFSPELQNRINNTDQSYDIAHNVDSVATANERLKNMPKAESDFLLNEKGGADHVATGYRLMQELDALGEHERALVIANKLAKDLTSSGQTSQAASILSRLSPEGQLLNLVRTAERNGKVVTTADSVKFKELVAKVQERSGAGIRANQFNDILNRLERGENVGVDDIKKLSNFLSGAEKITKPKVLKVVDDLPAELKEPRKREKIVNFLDEAEQAALARIAARRNNLNSLPVNEWADHAIVAAAQIAKGSIRAATHIEDLVKLFGEQIRPVATEVFQNAQKLLKTSSQSVSKGDIAKANEILRKISGEKQPLPEKIVEKYVSENGKVSQKDIDTLRELAKKVTNLSGDQKVNADIEMQKILNSYEKSSAWDKLLAIRYMSMLLNSSTQAINALSGPLMSTTGYAADILGTMVDIAMNKTLKTPRTTTLYGSNPLKFMARWFKHGRTGAKAGWHGVNPAGIQSTNEIRGLAFPGKYNPLGIAERTLGAIAKGADYATYKSVFDSEILKQGFLDAKNKGIKGKADIQKHIDSFVNNPPEEAILQADRIGKNTTFQRSDTTGGKVANFLNSSPNAIKPVVNAVFPFVRTPINIASTAVTLTPAGIVKGLYQLTSKSPASQREAIRTLSLGLTGSAGIGPLGYYLESIGVITGANDSGDKDVNNIRDQAGKGKYRFNTSALSRYLEAMFNGEGSEAAEQAAQYREGDSAFDYNKLQPLAFPLAIGASLSENKDKPMLERVGQAAEDAYGSLYGMSTLKGVQDVFQPSYGGTIGEKALGTPMRIAESFFKSFSPSAWAQEARRQDPISRKTPYNEGFVKDVGDYFKSRTPGLSQSLPPNKTTLGQNKTNAPGIRGQYLNPYKSEVAPYNDAAKIISDLINATGDKTLAPSAPEKTVRGKDKKGNPVSMAIPTERYAKMQEEVGNEIIKKVMALSPNLSDAKKAEKLKDIYSVARERARNKVKKELGVR